MQKTVAAQALRGSWDIVIAVQMPVAQYACQVSATCQRIADVDTAMSFQMYERYRREHRHLARARRWISWQKAYRYERNMLRYFQAATVVWQAEADSLCKMVKNTDCSVAVIPNGVDCAHNRRGFIEPRANTLVYSGSLTYTANFEAMRWFLAEIYPLIKERAAGRAPGHHGHHKRRRSIAATPGRQCGTYRLCRGRAPVCGRGGLLVVPVHEGGGTRLKILESMALGTPVVSTTKGVEGLEAVAGKHLLVRRHTC